MNLMQRIIAGLIGIRIPDLTRPIENKKHKFGSDSEYFVGSVVKSNGVKVPALFTRDQLAAAIVRAERNPEDIE